LEYSDEKIVMTQKKNMFLFYFSITLAIVSSALYHFVAKSTPSNVNFTVSLLVTYAVAFVVTLLGFFFFPATNGIASEIKNLCSPTAPVGIWESPRYWSM
jgi:uncharacterized Tic20 family protein